jgi:hypothetical protein
MTDYRLLFISFVFERRIFLDVDVNFYQIYSDIFVRHKFIISSGSSFAVTKSTFSSKFYVHFRFSKLEFFFVSFIFHLKKVEHK